MAERAKKQQETEGLILGMNLDPQLVKDNYFSKDKQALIFNLTEEDLIDYKDEFYQLNKLLDEKMVFMESVREILTVDANEEEEIKEALGMLVEMAELSPVGIKTLKKKIAETLTIINKEFVEREVMVFNLQDHADEMIYEYLENGTFIKARQMNDDEKQMIMRLKTSK
jgi:hypothetical protein